MKCYYYYDGKLNTYLKKEINHYTLVINLIPCGNSENSISSLIDTKLSLIKSQPNNKIVIFADDEGYFGAQFYHILNESTFEDLNKWILKNKLNHFKFYFISHNLISDEICDKLHYSFKSIGRCIYSERYLNMNENDDMYFYNIFNKNKIEKLFLSYNRNIKLHRFYLRYKLFENDLIKNSIYSYNGIQNGAPHRDYIKLLSDINKNDIDFNIYEELENIEYNILHTFSNETSYGKEIILEDYEKTFLSLVTETEFALNTVYLSEKTFKPIYCKHPFILVSSPYTLRELKKLGYKTFDKWWDESYDECEELTDRINMIIDILINLNSKSSDELFKIRMEMKDILDYNHDLYMNRRNINFLNEILDEINLDN